MPDHGYCNHPDRADEVAVVKMQTFKNNTTEIFIEGEDGVSVTVNPWANQEGVNVMMHGKDLSLRFAAAMTWEESALLLAAISAARAS